MAGRRANQIGQQAIPSAARPTASARAVPGADWPSARASLLVGRSDTPAGRPTELASLSAGPVVGTWMRQLREL